MKSEKNNYLIGFLCLLTAIPLPTLILQYLHYLKESNSFKLFDLYYVSGSTAYATLLLLISITIGLSVIATRELGGFIVSQSKYFDH